MYVKAKRSGSKCMWKLKHLVLHVCEPIKRCNVVKAKNLVLHVCEPIKRCNVVKAKTSGSKCMWTYQEM